MITFSPELKRHSLLSLDDLSDEQMIEMIDLAVASLLMSMGMMMVPPVTISLPLKLLLFVLADGWNLVVGSLISSFR